MSHFNAEWASGLWILSFLIRLSLSELLALCEGNPHPCAVSLNKLLNKQSSCQYIEMLWCWCDVTHAHVISLYFYTLATFPSSSLHSRTFIFMRLSLCSRLQWQMTRCVLSRPHYPGELAFLSGQAEQNITQVTPNILISVIFDQAPPPDKEGAWILSITYIHRADFRFAFSQWEMVSHWLDASLESALIHVVMFLWVENWNTKILWTTVH